jgi:hypothetical protein
MSSRLGHAGIERDEINHGIDTNARILTDKNLAELEKQIRIAIQIAAAP